jgi:hypothetical protein
MEAANDHVQGIEEWFPLGQFNDYQFLQRAESPQDGLVLKVGGVEGGPGHAAASPRAAGSSMATVTPFVGSGSSVVSWADARRPQT